MPQSDCCCFWFWFCCCLAHKVSIKAYTDLNNITIIHKQKNRINCISRLTKFKLRPRFLFSLTFVNDNNSIYVTGQVFKWIRENGRISAFQSCCATKSALVYDVIDNSSGFYKYVTEQLSIYICICLLQYVVANRLYLF